MSVFDFEGRATNVNNVKKTCNSMCTFVRGYFFNIVNLVEQFSSFMLSFKSEGFFTTTNVPRCENIKHLIATNIFGFSMYLSV